MLRPMGHGGVNMRRDLHRASPIDGPTWYRSEVHVRVSVTRVGALVDFELEQSWCECEVRTDLVVAAGSKINSSWADSTRLVGAK